jgi:hypothetical protein
VTLVAGYSGTPLAKKLGIKAGHRLAIVNDPGHAQALLEPLPEGVDVTSGCQPADVVVFFATTRGALEQAVDELGEAIFPASTLWVAWPKKSAAKRMATERNITIDLTEDLVRAVVLPRGLVDVKVAAIDDDWSGLKVVWRKERRN